LYQPLYQVARACVLLISVGELAAGQRLDVDEAVRVGVSREIDRIGLRRADGRQRRGGRDEQQLFHSCLFEFEGFFRPLRRLPSRWHAFHA